MIVPIVDVGSVVSFEAKRHAPIARDVKLQIQPDSPVMMMAEDNPGDPHDRRSAGNRAKEAGS